MSYKQGYKIHSSFLGEGLAALTTVEFSKFAGILNTPQISQPAQASTEPGNPGNHSCSPGFPERCVCIRGCYGPAGTHRSSSHPWDQAPQSIIHKAQHPRNNKTCKRKNDILKRVWDFPGGTVDKNLPGNAGDMGSIPGSRRFHMP